MVRMVEVSVLVWLLYTCSARNKIVHSAHTHIPFTTQPSQLKTGFMPPLRSLAVTPVYTRHHYWYTYADRPLRSSTRSNASLGPMDCRQPRSMSDGRRRYEDDRSIRLRRDQARWRRWQRAYGRRRSSRDAWDR
jgi:hypothetical protein